jgi:hypothetical protein
MHHSGQNRTRRRWWIAAAAPTAFLLFLIVRLDVAFGIGRGSVTGWVRVEGWNAVGSPYQPYPEAPLAPGAGPRAQIATYRILSVTSLNGRMRRTFSLFEGEPVRQIQRAAGAMNSEAAEQSTSPVWGRLEYAGLGRHIVTRFVPEPVP